MRQPPHRTSVRVRLDGLQGDVPLRELPRALRALQADLTHQSGKTNAMSVMFHPLRVRSVQPDTAEAVVVSFDVPENLRTVFGFTQGQYLTLRKEIDGQDLRRSYSICDGVDEGELRVGVRKV